MAEYARHIFTQILAFAVLVIFIYNYQTTVFLFPEDEDGNVDHKHHTAPRKMVESGEIDSLSRSDLVVLLGQHIAERKHEEENQENQFMDGEINLNRQERVEEVMSEIDDSEEIVTVGHKIFLHRELAFLNLFIQVILTCKHSFEKEDRCAMTD